MSAIWNTAKAMLIKQSHGGVLQILYSLYLIETDLTFKLAILIKLNSNPRNFVASYNR